MNFEERETLRRLENERGRAYRSLLEAGHVFLENESAPSWALHLSELQNCGARHFEALNWPRIWQRAVRDPDWPRAFEAVCALEDVRAKDLRGQAGSYFETGKRIATWLDKSTTRKRCAS